ncbi:hypothetical protein RBH94_06455 [Aestuariibaculum sp. YM273]|uniref:hypothetical protein n=1 Tax=Aestuariibaculum sp. YM273 TaxID=3070659 RepID=UPI0027DD9598|nr:hypothetical protein [Aestuariibaculum sp. YM273]WMI66802.1 hypothetical protein RBH94_06455 [Aestuariibaculum sp. YM273]
MKRYVFLLLGLMAFVNCKPPEFERNTRVLVKGKMIDENNQPISEVEISVYTYRFSGYIFDAIEDEYLLGLGKSKTDGSFEVVSLFDKDEDFAIVINGNEKYTNYTYLSSTTDHTPEDLVFDLEDKQLKSVSKVNYSISRTSPEGTTFRFSFQYSDINCIEYFNEGVLEPELSRCFFEANSGSFLNDTYPDYSNSFLTPIGTVVEFHYSINDQPEIIETFTVDQENYEFEFSY